MNDPIQGIPSRRELELVSLAIRLGAAETGGPLSPRETDVVDRARRLDSVSAMDVDEIRTALIAGFDPLGDVLYRHRPAETRRRAGAVYTPSELVAPMVRWVLDRRPARIVDPGCGTGRYAVAAARQERDVEVVAVDVDPVATLLCRGALAVVKAERATVRNESFIGMQLQPVDGRTAFVGNPPYVRHHRIPSEDKEWLIRTAARLGDENISTRAGLHAYFFFVAREIGRDGDIGCFLTPSEWLDVNYGRGVRRLLLDGLGAAAIDVLHPRSRAFRAVDSTALITCFEFGSRPSMIRLRQVRDVGELATVGTGQNVDVAEFAAAKRWTTLLKGTRESVPSGYARVPLRRVVSVRRGIATGANSYFVLAPEAAKAAHLMEWSVPVITRATEIIESRGVIREGPEQKRLLLVPPDARRSEHRALHSYLCIGEHAHGAEARIKDRYLCRQREPWYCVEWPDPAPVVVTYMARKPPAFALNPDRLGLLNIGHYLRPLRGDLDVDALVHELNRQSERLVGGGRTYQGGLEKFEPREMLNLEVDLPKRMLKPEEYETG